MLAMQYSIHLPVGYDAARIRERVAERSALFNGLPGLVHKSYLFSKEDMIYAPFYIWSDISKAQRFLFDDLFRDVAQTFRRPRVRSWMVMDSGYGNKDIAPAHAIREVDVVAAEDNLDALLKSEKEAQGALAKNPALHFYATLLDPERWEIVRYSLWKDAASAPKSLTDCVQSYDVLHFQDA